MQKHEWHDAIKLNHQQKYFGLKTNKFKISFYQDGKYLQSSNFSIEDDENPKHLVVKSVDGATYQIQNVDASETEDYIHYLKIKRLLERIVPLRGL